MQHLRPCGLLLVGAGYLFGESIEYAVRENWGIASVVMLVQCPTLGFSYSILLRVAKGCTKLVIQLIAAVFAVWTEMLSRVA